MYARAPVASMFRLLWPRARPWIPPIGGFCIAAQTDLMAGRPVPVSLVGAVAALGALILFVLVGRALEGYRGWPGDRPRALVALSSACPLILIPSIFVSLQDPEIALSLGLIGLPPAIVLAFIPWVLALLPPAPVSFLGRLDRRAGALLGLTVFAAVGLWATLEILRIVTLHGTTGDLGLFNQIFWATIHGQFLYSSVEGINYFGDHFSPLLLGVVPLYALHPSAVTLVLVHTVALSLGAVPLYFIAKDQLHRSSLALGVSVAYLAYPTTQLTYYPGFNADALGVPILFTLLYFLLRWKPWPLLACCLLYLAVKEDRALVVMAVGLYASLYMRQRRWGALIFLVALAWFLVAIRMVVPIYNPTGYRYLSRYIPAGQVPILFTLGQVAATPWGRFLYAYYLFAPLLFLPLASLRWGRWTKEFPNLLLLAIPPLAENLFTLYFRQYLIGSKTANASIPILFVAAILGIGTAARWVPRLVERLGGIRSLSPGRAAAVAVAGLVASSAATGIFIGRSPLSPYFDSSFYTLGPREAQVLDILTVIPENASVALHCCPSTMTRGLAAQLSYRMEYHHWPSDQRPTDYLVVDLESLTQEERVIVANGSSRGPWTPVAEAGDVQIFTAPGAPRAT